MLYEVLENEVRINLQKSFRDYECSLKLGEIQDTFLKNDYVSDIVIDMSKTEWADPLPLLSLGCMFSF